MFYLDALSSWLIYVPYNYVYDSVPVFWHTFFIYRGVLMYTVSTEASFDSAHFLKNYDGKCANLHGHRWRVLVEVKAEKLGDDSMVIDFTDLKRDLKEIADFHDHCLIIEKDSLKDETLACLKAENFRIVEVPFRPTAECFAKYFCELMRAKGHNISKVSVYETPNNCATYED